MTTQSKIPQQKIDETIAEIEIQNCLTFICNRIVDEETNTIKKNECPVCMEQMKDPVDPDDYDDKVKYNGFYCDHLHCLECYFAIMELDEKCSICRQFFKKQLEQMKDPVEEEEEEDEEEFNICECCHNEAPWDGQLGVTLCNQCYSSEVQLGNIEQNILDGFTIAIIDGQRTAVDLNISNLNEIFCCQNCYTHSNIGDLLDLFDITGEVFAILVCSNCEIQLQKCSGCGRRNTGEWRPRYDCRYCDQCFEGEERHLNQIAFMESNHQIEMTALRLEVNRL